MDMVKGDQNFGPILIGRTNEACATQYRKVIKAREAAMEKSLREREKSLRESASPRERRTRVS
ncbi:hypothetical protein A2U01_0103494, partial [Trifolium medium]|nr:hypothetical protein [Trifolium medium]